MRIKTDGDRDGNVQDQQVLVIRNLGSESHARVSDCLTVYNFSLDGATPTVINIDVSFSVADAANAYSDIRFCSSGS